MGEDQLDYNSFRMGTPKGLATQKLYLVVHGGFDFDPTTLCVCHTEKKAKQMIEEHYKKSENKDHPWNGVGIVEANLNDWIDYDAG